MPTWDSWKLVSVGVTLSLVLHWVDNTCLGRPINRASTLTNFQLSHVGITMADEAATLCTGVLGNKLILCKMRKVVHTERVGVALGVLGFNVGNGCFEHSLPGSIFLAVESHSKLVLPIRPAHGERDICDGNNWKHKCELHS